MATTSRPFFRRYSAGTSWADAPDTIADENARHAITSRFITDLVDLFDCDIAAVKLNSSFCDQSPQ